MLRFKRMKSIFKEKQNITSMVCKDRKYMTKEELKEYLRTNLEIRVTTHNNGLHVVLVLDNEVISTSGVALF